MAKLIAVFGIFASAASIAGFFLALQFESRNELAAVAFVLALGMILYVLTVPANRVERNVKSRLQHFKNPAGDRTSTVQRGEFSIADGGPTRIEFHQPFNSLPCVEVVHTPGRSGKLPTVSNISEIGAEFHFHSYTSGFAKTFVWVAHGDALEPVHTADRNGA
jgi:hypothetical protein